MFGHNNTGTLIQNKVRSCFTAVERLLLTASMNKSSQHVYEPFLYLACLATLTLTMSSQRLYEHNRARGDNLRYRRLLLAIIISNAAVALCLVLNAMITFVELVSDWTINSCHQCRLCIITSPALSLKQLGMYIDPASMSSGLLFRPSGVAPKGVDKTS